MSKTAAALAESALARAQKEAEGALERFLPKDEPAKLHEAMRYSTLGGGKRVRPTLCLLAAEAAGGEKGRARALGAACALECIHVYSLVHDDLPAMDDDALRRGRPTSHVVYGENVAILAGDGLFAEAVRLFCEQQEGDPPAVLSALGELLAAIGVDGMVGGQYIDVTTERIAASAAPGGRERLSSRAITCCRATSTAWGTPRTSSTSEPRGGIAPGMPAISTRRAASGCSGACQPWCATAAVRRVTSRSSGWRSRMMPTSRSSASS